MNQLVWRGETVNGKYLGEVAILTELSPVVHCESFVDGHWRLWSYIEDKEQVIQQGKSASLEEATYICEQTALAIQGLQGLQGAAPMSPAMPTMPMMPMPMLMPNMYMQAQTSYENVKTSIPLQELRFKFRRWAISLTLIGGVFLSIWYSMMLKPVSTISMLIVLASIIWGAHALIKSFKRPKVSVAHPRHSSNASSNPAFATATIFPTAQMMSQMTPQFKPDGQLGMARTIPQAIPQAIPQTIQALSQLPMQGANVYQGGYQVGQQAIQQQAVQTDFYNPQLQYYQRSNG